MPENVKNKIKRQHFWLRHKVGKGKAEREERFARRKEEDRDPKLREDRRARNIPQTLESKRKWDTLAGAEDDDLGLAVDVQELKRRKLDAEAEEAAALEAASEEEDEQDGAASDADSMLDGDSGDDTADASSKPKSKPPVTSRQRAVSPQTSTASTNFQLTPEFLSQRFPRLFQPSTNPKILITTQINSTLHDQARLLVSLFPSATYIRRSAHRFSHKFSIREISRFAANREFTHLFILNEEQKRPVGLDIVLLPEGPMFHFKLSNWVEGKKLPGHGLATEHIPELILNNFRTPLGLLTAHLFRTIFPASPNLEGRQVITLHNQRDYVFFRRHRYIFRDKRETEKPVTDPNTGKPVEGMEGVRAGLQELGPRFTLKLRRVDRGIQRSSGQEWEWGAGMEKDRTRFQM